MKKIIVVALLSLITNATFSQQNDPSPTLSKQDYLLKSKHQKTAAWIMAGGGFVLTTTSIVIIVVKGTEDFLTFWASFFIKTSQYNNYSAESFLFITGAVAMLTSIPLFIASGKNKRKAMSLSFKNETAPQIYKSSLVYKSLPSLTLKFKL